jgi:RNA polymerase nonessential primary-like sigma factor
MSPVAAEALTELSHRLDAPARAARTDPRARAELIEAMLPLLRRWARRYAGRGVDDDDLVQDAVVGVLRAALRYDPARGPFLPWARLWVRQAMQQTVAESSRPVRLPTHVLWDMHELKEARERLTRELGRAPRAMELADALGWGRDHLVDVLAVERPPVDAAAADLVEYPEASEQFEQVLVRIASDQLRPLLLHLSERERTVLAARAEGDSLRTIGRRLGVSGERVRTIEERALARIRAAARLGVDTSPRLLTRGGGSQSTSDGGTSDGKSRRT